MSLDPKPWPPTKFLRVIRVLNTSMNTAEIWTDAGRAYIKALGNPEGPHALACEWVATQLARWYGLATFDFAVLEIDASIDELPFYRGGRAATGPAFVTRAIPGRPWGGESAALAILVNREAISHLVVFDTWVQNCDRHPPEASQRKRNLDNVFLAEVEGSGGAFRLMAIDHTHCFTCGRELLPRMADIEHERDNRLYGLFPEFVPELQATALSAAADRLLQIDETVVRPIIQSIPNDWEVSESTRSAWQNLILRRARFVAKTIVPRLIALCPKSPPMNPAGE